MTQLNDVACVLAISDFLKISDKQHCELLLRSIIQCLSPESLDPSVHNFTLQNGVLYHHNFHSDGPGLLLIVPSHLRSSILYQLHGVPTAGHLGMMRIMTECGVGSSGLAFTDQYAATLPRVTPATVKKSPPCFLLDNFIPSPFPISRSLGGPRYNNSSPREISGTPCNKLHN